ncbi:fibro-slime domain-containing protein [Collinsella tanakaei]|uniref:fibro-slime domain-containing protein n=1 Tax=Collinsella tanakaei TaxID=626935 RepID=UPI0025A33E3B|nr:fibro-slime domain-containing protein [Collinsella tanakaei]MDM8302401.1 fibro-slime domain-containing protein [Collinsella tanakaei]
MRNAFPKRKRAGASRIKSRWIAAGACCAVAATLFAAHSFTSPSFTVAEESADAAGAVDTWTASLPADMPTAWDEAVVAVANSQLGYRESADDVVILDGGEQRGSTRYGEWAGDAHAAWNALFASFCVENAGVGGMSADTDAQTWLETLQVSGDGLYAAAADHAAEPGDLVFTQAVEDDGDAVESDVAIEGEAAEADTETEAEADATETASDADDEIRVGVVTEVIAATEETPAQLTVVEGDVDGEVAKVTYAADDEAIVGYGLLPEQPADDEAAETEDADVVDETTDTVALDDTFTYETDNYTIDVTVAGDAALADASEDAVADIDVENATDAEGIAMDTTELGADDAAYQAAEAYVDDSDPESVLNISALQFAFTYNSQALDVSGCEVTAEVTPGDALQNAANAIETDDDTVEDAEVGVTLTALQSVEGTEAEELDSLVVEKDATERPTMTLALNAAAPALQLVARDAPNPHFTVQYYANLKMTDRDSGGYLKIINTDNGGKGKGGNLPENGESNPSMTGLYLEDGGGAKREIRTSMELTELYTANEYEYFEAPSLPYVNIFRENGNYTANEVWVLKSGRDDSSTNRDDWTIYSGIVAATELHFTNNPNKKNDPNTILIEEGTVIRLVANQTTGPYDNGAIFYDYDITDDGETTWDATNGSHGINSGSNYSGSGAKLAFGNVNTGTGLGNESWEGNTLNKFNEPNRNNNLQGTTFGLVTGLDENGHIQYADGVNAPKMFDGGTATGKTTYDGWSLGFNRQGDTYTLSSVNDGSTNVLEGLEQFNNPVCGTTVHDHIWTNNFWPMDDHPGKDGLTGDYMDRGKYVGYDGNELYPPSDDGLDHNNMFGMQYEVKFKLTEDYVGPLEYYFFGDDDMWVFLDGKLVCDIGGVHSSVGMYVNLWDYIEKGNAGEHTLKFYYTERGLSGSTCYMQFTLPSVSSTTPSYQNSQLKVQKEVVGNADPKAEFSFGISIDHESQPVKNSDYSIVRYNAKGERIESTLLTDGNGTFKLKANEYVIIDYLQHGTKYTITETGVPDSCVVSNVIDKGTVNQSETVTGTIVQGKGSIVLFTNSFRPKLPDTGGPGTVAFTLTGGALVATATYLGFHRRKSTSR